jgi:BRCA1-associated protein
VLLKFKDRQSTVAFYQKYNGRRFNMTQPEVSHVVYLRKYTIETQLIPPNSYPYLNTTVRQLEPMMYELPLCPVCLERMDQNITGLLNNACHHTQQCDCLHKWGKPSCPICIYSHKPNMYSKEPITVTERTFCCFECQSLESVWICLICGNLGCGRYQEAHAYDHYRETNHIFALEIETQHIWDYVTDGYVHRLIQQVDGGFVELPENNKHAVESEHKLDQISLDYSYMLTSQLDSQRIYYEEQMDLLSKSLSAIQEKVTNVQQEVERSEKEREALEKKGKSLDSSMLEIKKEKDKVDKRMISLKDKCEASQRNLNEEKLVKEKKHKLG